MAAIGGSITSQGQRWRYQGVVSIRATFMVGSIVMTAGSGAQPEEGGVFGDDDARIVQCPDFNGDLV
jgi:hypothetical protein